MVAPVLRGFLWRVLPWHHSLRQLRFPLPEHTTVVATVVAMITVPVSGLRERLLHLKAMEGRGAQAVSRRVP